MPYVIVKYLIPELKKYLKYYLSYQGYYYIPDNMISEEEIKQAISKYDGFGYLHEDDYYGPEGVPVAGVGAWVIGREDLIQPE